MNRPAHIYGFDVLRVLGMGFVTFEHLSSIHHHEHLANFGPVNIGQLGVAIFIAVSAYSGMISHNTPQKWIQKRFAKIYPAYWIVMAGCFCAVWVSGYKTFNGFQFASQMLGTGFFTHPESLINVPTWFISILLLGYVTLFTSRLSGRPAFVLTAILVLVLVVTLGRTVIWPHYHFLLFIGVSLATTCTTDQNRIIGIIVAAVAFAIASAVRIEFIYGVISCALLAIALCELPKLRWLTHVSQYSYEYYLVHGPCILATRQLFPTSLVLAVLSGIGIAVVVAILLHQSLLGLPIGKRIEFAPR